MSLADDFKRSFDIDGIQWIEEAEALAGRITPEIAIAPNFDHALLVGVRFVSMAGPLEDLGYSVGSDETLYLGEVEGLRYVGIAATLPSGSAARARGWFDHVLISQPAHQPAYDHLQRSHDGGPVLHHVALPVSNPARAGETDEDYALRVIPEFLRVRERVGRITGEPLQKLTMSLPEGVLVSERFQAALARWTEGSGPDSLATEPMMGGGFFLQFASSASYRVEVVLRHGTVLGFNPVAQTKLSRDVSYSS